MRYGPSEQVTAAHESWARSEFRHHPPALPSGTTGSARRMTYHLASMAVAGAMTSDYASTPRAGSEVLPSGRAARKPVWSWISSTSLRQRTTRWFPTNDIWHHFSPTEPSAAQKQTSFNESNDKDTTQAGRLSKVDASGVERLGRSARLRGWPALCPGDRDSFRLHGSPAQQGWVALALDRVLRKRAQGRPSGFRPQPVLSGRRR